MMEFLFKSITGYVLIAAYLFFVGLMVWLIIDLRGANFMPADFVEHLDEMLRNKQFKEGFELARADASPFGKVMAAGMARLSSGLPEARDAAEFMIESAKNRKEAMALDAIIDKARLETRFYPSDAAFVDVRFTLFS